MTESTNHLRLRRLTIGPLAVLAALVLAAPTPPTASAGSNSCGGKRGTIFGTAGDDVIRTPRYGHDVIIGFGGDDVIVSRNGRDTVCGGDGDDRIDGGIGPDRLFGGAGADAIDGGRGSDLIAGEEDGDALVGGRGKDRIEGGPGANRLRGGIGPDRIVGGDEADDVDGGSNRDAINSGGGNDLVDGGPGGDVADGGEGDDVVWGRDGGDRLYGGGGEDRIFGGLVDDWLWGGSGGDVLIGGHGIDLMHGDSGDDLLRGDTNRNLYDGGPGFDTASFATVTPGVGILSGFGVVVDMNDGSAVADGHNDLEGIEHVLGSSFRDDMVGTPNATADGGPGNDDCTGFAGAVNCSGQALEHRVLIDDRDPRDPGLVLVGGPGPDRWTARVGSGVVRVHAETTLQEFGESCEQLDPSTIECPVTPLFVVAYGGDQDDTIEVSGTPPTGATVDIDGGFGDDRLTGGSSDDVLIDRGGRDRMNGGGGSDAMISAAGPDVLLGGSGNDQMVTTNPCEGHVFAGGKGNLDIAGFARSKVAVRVKRGGKATRKKGGRCDATRVRASSEVLEGSAFGDVLIGSRRADFLIGGRGADLLDGRGGRDQFNGGSGSDRCLLGPATVSAKSCERR